MADTATLAAEVIVKLGRGRTRALSLSLSLLVACSAADAGQGGEAVGVTGDSILAMPVMMERFQKKHPPVTGFADDAPTTRAELIARFAQAIRDSSASALRSLTMTEAEFAHLYFPTSPYVHPPHELVPEVSWLLTQQNGLKGETRLLRAYGGRHLDITGHECEPQPHTEGGNRIWGTCRLALRQEDGSVLEDVRLFGSILERDGRFKFISLANGL